MSVKNGFVDRPADFRPKGTIMSRLLATALNGKAIEMSYHPGSYAPRLRVRGYKMSIAARRGKWLVWCEPISEPQASSTPSRRGRR